MKNVKILSAIILMVCTLSHSAYATNYTWRGTNDTLWTNSSNWSPAGTPGSNDTVTIVSVTYNPNDAELAVDIEDDAEFLIENSTFNRNRVHIRIADTKNATEPIIPKNGGTMYNRINIIAGNTFNCDAVLNVTSSV